MTQSKKYKETVKTPFRNVSQTLRVLMKEMEFKESEIVRRSGLSQQRCNRIINGLIENPRANTLIALAQCFEITVGQLVGTEPIEKGN